MWSRRLFLVWFFTLTILTTQSHVIHKRGLLSKLFGGSRQSNRDVETEMTPRERSRFRELLKNPVVISMLSAAVGMAIQQALSANNMGDICNNKYIKMASTVGIMNPQLQQAINLLGCNAPNRKYGSDKSKDKYSSFTTTPAYDNDEDNENEGEQSEDQNKTDDEDVVESGIPPEKHSKLKQLISITRGEKGAKRNFIKGLFGLSKKDQTFKKGQKLPSSSYKLDKDDANAMKDLEKDIEHYNKVIT
ncbi:unnamed protein product [Rotaria sordida]|uniref:Uncharacterized protein n=1 Tax=Rotaria sordida TaxID=392033 RepID=A0A814CER1_9BILA|nr:unnamed protein product [Rotaria sordida]CAF0941098.1 unnamed protein product [Rotaria sordida]CAF3799743.1 unnamed protein product [Rotaria sordida]CAF4000553.1 unnamed protein product [Rotaria sordida]